MAKVQEIVSELKTIYDILLKDSTTYFIPYFQRDFVWNRDDVQQLLDDMSNDTDNFTIESDNLEGYLLGNIVLIDDSDNNRKQVVDGQQRLTTLTIMAKALNDVILEMIEKTDGADKTSWIQQLSDLAKAYSVINDDGDIKSLKILHDPGLLFGTYYRKLMLDEAKEEDIEKEADSNIAEIYKTSYEYIQGLDDKQLRKFIKYFRNKIKLIETIAPTEAKAFQLFEILNDRGRSLEPMDLIKNGFLRTLTVEGKPDSKIEQFIDDWKQTMDNLEPSKNKKLSSTIFLRQFLLAYRGVNIYSNKLFDYFKNEKNGFDGDSILEFVKAMRKASAVYARIETGKYSDYNDDQNMYILIKLLGIKQFHPILMLFSDEDEDRKREILDAITRLGAAIVFSYYQTNTIEKLLPDVIAEYYTKKKKDSDDAYFKLLESITSNIEMYAGYTKSILVERNHVGKNGTVNTKAAAILKFIELYYNENTKVKVNEKGKKITVEHILSRSLDLSAEGITIEDLGFESEKEMDGYLHRIGNLTILYNTDNSALGNSVYDEKKEVYKKSNFVLTSTIVEPMTTPIKNGKDTEYCKKVNAYEKQYNSDSGLWTKDLIDSRSNDISNLVYAILTKNYSTENNE